MSSYFGLIGFTVSEIVRLLDFRVLAWICTFTPTFRVFVGKFPRKDVAHCCNPQKAPSCLETRRLSHKAWKSVHRFDLGAGSRKKGQDRTVKNVTEALYFTYLGEVPTELVFTKISVVVAVGAVPDVMTFVKFGLRFSGVSILHGVEFSVFVLILVWALQQWSASALPVIQSKLFSPRAHDIVPPRQQGFHPILKTVTPVQLLMTMVPKP